MKKETCAGCIVINNNKVLMVKQNNGVVSFPKGHTEENETLFETAIREVFEETGYKVKIIDENPFVVTYSPKENVSKDVYFYMASIASGDAKAQEKEISEVKWVDIDLVLNEFTYDNMKELWQKVLHEKKL